MSEVESGSKIRALQEAQWAAMNAMRVYVKYSTSWHVMWREISPDEIKDAKFWLLGVRVPYWLFKCVHGPVMVRREDVTHASGGRSRG